MCQSTLISQHRWAFNLHHRWSTSSSRPPSSPICTDLSISIIADLHRALDLHHRQSALISQPPSSPICDSLPFTIIVLQSLSFTISNLQVKVVVFINFLFISLFQSHVSLVSICILWICGLLVFGFVDLFFSVDLFFQICEICGLWSLSFGWNWIRPLCTQAWSARPVIFHGQRQVRRPATQPDRVGSGLSTNPNRTDSWTPLLNCISWQIFYNNQIQPISNI